MLTIVYSFSQSCGHVGAVLFCVVDLIASGITFAPENTACTDVLCKWTDPKGICCWKFCKFCSHVFILLYSYFWVLLLIFWL